MKLFLILSLYFNFTQLTYVDAACDDDFYSRVGAYFRAKIGVLPASVKVRHANASKHDLILWEASLRNGETVMTEVYDQKGNFLSRSGLKSSGKYQRIENGQWKESFTDALEQAHSVCSELNGCTVRLVHTHPVDNFGEDLHFSGADIKASYSLKSLIEVMGYEKISLQMDIVVSDRAGSANVLSYTLGPEFTVANGNIAFPASLKKHIAQHPEIKNVKANFEAINGKNAEAIHAAFKIKEDKTYIAELDKLNAFAKKAKVNFLVVKDDVEWDKSSTFGLNNKLDMPFGAFVTILETPPLLKELKRASESKSTFQIFISNSDPNLLDQAEALSGVYYLLQKAGFRGNMEAYFYLENKLYKQSFEYDSEQPLYVSDKVIQEGEKISFDIKMISP